MCLHARKVLKLEDPLLRRGNRKANISSLHSMSLRTIGTMNCLESRKPDSNQKQAPKARALFLMPEGRLCVHPASECSLRQGTALVACTSNLLKVTFPGLALTLSEHEFLCKPSTYQSPPLHGQVDPVEVRPGPFNCCPSISNGSCKPPVA